MATTSPTHRPLRADARRNRDAIVQAARELVAEQGTEAQVADVAERAGVGVGTVYRHFPTKEALMAELIRACLVENAEIARRAQGAEDAWEAFAAVVREGCASMAADAAKRRMWTAASAEAMAAAQDAKREMVEATAVVIERARAEGALRADFTVEDMPGLMCGLGAAIDAPGDWRRIVEFALDGLRART